MRRRWIRRARVAAFAVAGAVVALLVAGRVHSEVGPFDTTVSAVPALHGNTIVRLAPLGSIEFDTHDAPVAVELRVDQLRLAAARQIVADPKSIDLLDEDLAGEVRGALRALALRCVLVATAGGLLGGLLARLHWRTAVAGAAVGMVMASSMGAVSAATFDADAVVEPRYRGLLTLAPTAVGDVETLLDNFGEYRAQLRELVRNVALLYEAGQTLPTVDLSEDTIRVLHVSDIHLNPNGFDLAREVADQFDVDVVVDTGDITDFGTLPEAPFVDNIETLDVPYVYVRGNHDSAHTQRAVERQSNAIVLDGESVEVAGLRFWGLGDPRYTPAKDQPVGLDVEHEQIDAFAPDVALRLDGSEPPQVDVVLIHDPRAAADLGDRVPLVLAGHTHLAGSDTIGDGTLLLVEGSTGGAGLRALKNEQPEPLTCTVLYFDPDTRRLVAYDRITVQGLGEAGATIERHVVPPQDG